MTEPDFQYERIILQISRIMSSSWTRRHSSGSFSHPVSARAIPTSWRLLLAGHGSEGTPYRFAIRSSRSTSQPGANFITQATTRCCVFWPSSFFWNPRPRSLALARGRRQGEPSRILRRLRRHRRRWLPLVYIYSRRLVTGSVRFVLKVSAL